MVSVTNYNTTKQALFAKRKGKKEKESSPSPLRPPIERYIGAMLLLLLARQLQVRGCYCYYYIYIYFFFFAASTPGEWAYRRILRNAPSMNQRLDCAIAAFC